MNIFKQEKKVQFLISFVGVLATIILWYLSYSLTFRERNLFAIDHLLSPLIRGLDIPARPEFWLAYIVFILVKVFVTGFTVYYIRSAFGLDNYSLILSIFLFLCFGLTLYRIHFAINFTDESSSISTIYKFTLGAIPFRDDKFIAQTAILHFVPIYKAFVFLNGSSDGIVLFSRYLFLILQIAVGYVIFDSLKKKFGRNNSLIVSALYFLYLPSGLAYIYYNTAAMAFLTATLFSSYYLATDGEKKRYYFIYCLSLGFTALTYQSLLPGCILSLALTFFFSDKEKRKKLFKALVISALSLIAIFLILIRESTVSDLISTYEFSKTYKIFGGYEKIVGMINYIRINLPPVLLLIPLFLLFLISRIKGRELMVRYGFHFYFLCLLIYYSFGRFYTSSIPYSHEFFFIQNIALFAIIFIVSNGNEDQWKGFGFLIILPSVFFGLSVGYTTGSVTAPHSLHYGLVPAYLVGGLVALRYIPEKMNGSVHLGSIFLVFYLLVKFQYSFVYEEFGFARQNQYISQGPFKGIFTTDEKLNVIDDLSLKIKNYNDPDSKIIFYYSFPAGYLFTKQKHGVCATWIHERVTDLVVFEKSMIQCLSDMADKRTYVFRRIPKSSTTGIFSPTNVFHSILKRCGIRKIETTENFEISVMESGCRNLVK